MQKDISWVLAIVLGALACWAVLTLRTIPLVMKEELSKAEEDVRRIPQAIDQLSMKLDHLMARLDHPVKQVTQAPHSKKKEQSLEPSVANGKKKP